MERVDDLALQLKRLRTNRKIRWFRSRLDAETAKAVIRSPALTPVERSAISLCLKFGDADDRHVHGGSWILTEAEVDGSDGGG